MGRLETKDDLIMPIFYIFLIFPLSLWGSVEVPSNKEFEDIWASSKTHREISSQKDGLYFAKKYISSIQNKDCKSFKELHENENFPLSKFTILKVLEFCKINRKEFPSLFKKAIQEIPTWAKEHFLNLSLKWSQNLKLRELESQIYFELFRYGNTRKEKEDKLLKALRLSKDNPFKKKVRAELYKNSPRLNKTIKAPLYFEVARDYEIRRDFKKSRAFYLKVIRGKTFNIIEKAKAWNRLAMTYKKERNSQKYIDNLNELGSFLKKRIKNNSEIESIHSENQISLARAIWTQHKRDEAREVLLELQKRNSLTPDTQANIYWLLGAMKMEEDKKEEAIELFEKANSLKIQSEELKGHIIWSIGWNSYLKGEYRKAAKVFNQDHEDIESIHLKRKFQFWRAKSLTKANQGYLASRIYHQIAKEAPYSYYGILSFKELELPFTPLNPRPQKLESKMLPLFSWLYFLKEQSYAKNYLIEFISNYKGESEGVLPYLKYFANVGAYAEGIRAFYRIDPEERLDFIEAELDLLFPSPFKEVVQKISKKHDLSAAIIYSITRQESAFNPYARSWADAFGLMQLTPETAKVLAKDAKLKLDLPHELYDPEINITLGTKLFRRLKKKFNNNYILAIASYNASQNVVKRWFKERYDEDPIEFIEKIPYKETRNYVKLVLRNYIIYKRVLDEKKFYFPEEIILTEQL